MERPSWKEIQEWVSNNRTPLVVGILLCGLVIAIWMSILTDDFAGRTYVNVQVSQPITREESKLACIFRHNIVRGDWINTIAPKYGVSAELVVLANRDFLTVKYDETCASVPAGKRNRPGRKGLFCNDRYRRPYANTLRPSWTLCIPSQNVPMVVEQVVASMPGHKVALVIDDTGSMSDDRKAVATFYAQALERYGRNIVGIFLYADGHVNRVTAVGEAQVQGDFENAFEALRTAVEEVGPDLIYLVTDEPGDDWPARLDNLGFPTIVATCLPNADGHFECEQPLKRLASATGGKYVPISFGH